MTSARLRRPLLFLALAGALALIALAPLAAAQDRIPPAPDRWATDQAGFLSPQAVGALDARLENYERQSGHQLLVWIGRTLGDNAVLEDWAARAFQAWKVGRKGLDDGLVLFIFAEDRKIRVEVGYGLEDKVPDIYAYRVINNILAPGIRAGRPDEAVDAAVTALIGYISGDESAAGGVGAARNPREIRRQEHFHRDHHPRPDHRLHHQPVACPLAPHQHPERRRTRRRRLGRRRGRRRIQRRGRTLRRRRRLGRLVGEEGR